MSIEQKYMKYNFMAWLVYKMFEKSVFAYMETVYGRSEVKVMKKKAKRIYKGMLERTPAMEKNSANAPLLMGAMFFSIYKASDGKMSENVFAKLTDQVGHAPLFNKMITKRKLFTEEVHAKRLADAARSQSSQHPMDWIFTHKVFSPDEYLTEYTQCGVCELAKKEGCFALVKHICKIDYITYDLMGAHLERTKTIADGDELCDFHVTRKARTGP